MVLLHSEYTLAALVCAAASYPVLGPKTPITVDRALPYQPVLFQAPKESSIHATLGETSDHRFTKRQLVHSAFFVAMTLK